MHILPKYYVKRKHILVSIIKYKVLMNAMFWIIITSGIKNKLRCKQISVRY
jgi:hypothetical protein